MCTWSGIRWPSSIRLSSCAAERRRTSPRYGRSWPNKALRRPFGMNTTWYLHSQREWLRLSNSSIVARPSVCLAAHGSERHDGPPNMSNFCCLPGIAGGLPSFIYSSLLASGVLASIPLFEAHAQTAPCRVNGGSLAVGNMALDACARTIQAGNGVCTWGGHQIQTDEDSKVYVDGQPIGRVQNMSGTYGSLSQGFRIA